MQQDEAYKAHVGKALRLAIADLGLSQSDLMRRANLPCSVLKGEGSTIALDAFLTLMRLIDETADDPELPLKLGQASSVDFFDPAFFAAMCSPNLNTAASRLSDFKQVVGPLYFDVHMGSKATTLTYGCKAPDRTLPKILALTEAVFVINLMRRATRHHVVPQSILMPFMIEELAAYEAHFGCAISQGEQAEIQVSAVDACRPFMTHDDAMWSFFEPQLQRRVKESLSGQSTRTQVERILLQFLPSGRAQMDEVARELAVSKRTLQRRLSEDGTTWLKILNKSRETLAKRYLQETNLSAAEVSLLLGFEDPNSLFRAFKRWEGTSPELWRASRHLR